MNHRERLEKTIAGEATDRVPVALWRHFPGDDQRAADLARSTVDFQQTYDWDFVKVTPSGGFSVQDYGVQDVWEGDPNGVRATIRRAVVRSLEWTELRTLDPTRGSLARQIDCLRLIVDALGEDVPIIQTIFSPLTQAGQIAGQDVVLRHMRTQPDRLRSGLNVITDSTLRFIDAIRRMPIAGIFYATQEASYAVMSEDEYRSFGLPYDRKVLESLPERWWLNVLHLHGDDPMFRVARELPAQVINWHDRGTEPALDQARLMVESALCGGLSATDHVNLGSPTSIRETARDAMAQTNHRRLILAAGCVVPVTSPWSNLRAVRAAVEP